MSYSAVILVVTGFLFVAVFLLMEVGRRIAVQRAHRDPEKATVGLGAIEGAVYTFMGLLVTFSFSGAAGRFDERRHLVIAEANDIGTAYLRLDLLPAASQEALRRSFRQYLDSRLAIYRKLPDLEAAMAELQQSTRLQGEIWTQAVAASRAADSPATTTLVLSALNEMIDITTTRTMATKMHPPNIIFVLLIGSILASAVMAGHGMAANTKRSPLHMFAFAAICSLAVYVILDLEYPRLGLIRADSVDSALVDLRASMTP